VPGGAEFGREGDDHHEGCLHRNQGDQSRLQCAGKHREIVGQRTAADDAGIDTIGLGLVGAQQRVDMLGFSALVGGQLRPDRHVTGNLAVLPDRRDARQHPVEVAVLAAVLHRADPRLARLHRDPEVLERFRRHVWMAHDIVRLLHHFRFGEPRGCNELIVEKDDSPLGVRPGNNQRVVAEQVLDVGDGKIFSHGRTPKNDVYVRFNRGCRDLTYESSGGARSW